MPPPPRTRVFSVRQHYLSQQQQQQHQHEYQEREVHTPEEVFVSTSTTTTTFGSAAAAAATEHEASKVLSPAQAREEGEGIRMLGGLVKYGEYYVNLYTEAASGRPGFLRVQLDTGSSSLVVTSTKCGPKCTGAVGRFVLDKREILPCTGQCEALNACFGSLGCGFHLRYGDNSPQYSLTASGVAVRTFVSLSGESPSSRRSAEVDLYVILEETGSWPKLVDGILGLGFERLNCNPICYPPAWEKLLPSKTFTMCMGDVGGMLSFGPPPGSHTQEAFATTTAMRTSAVTGTASRPTYKFIKMPVLPNTPGAVKTYYVVACNGLGIVLESPPSVPARTQGGSRNSSSSSSVNPSMKRHSPPPPNPNHHDASSNNNSPSIRLFRHGNSNGAPVVPHSAIVDSGTTLLIVPAPVWDEFVLHMQTHYCHLDGVCGPVSIFNPPGEDETDEIICLSSNPAQTFPTLALVMDGDSALLLPPALYFIEYERDVFCLGIQRGQNFVVGDVVLRGFSTTFSPDAVMFSTYRTQSCGEVANLDSFEHLIVERAGHVSYMPSVAATSFGQRLTWLLALLTLFLLGVTAWRTCCSRRRHAEYTPL